jgi:hypothetical protein
MITFLDKKNKLNEQKNSLCVTYPRTVSIIIGHYPYPEAVHDFLLQIKNNIDPQMQNYTHVKGGMTNWHYFNDNPLFKNFLAYLINIHQISHPDIFQYFFEKRMVREAWGNEVKPGDRLNPHIHNHIHGILYLTEGCDLILPELNIAITPHPGDYYIFPPQVMHGFDKYEGKNNRYSLIFNIEENGQAFEFAKKVKLIDGKNS